MDEAFYSSSIWFLWGTNYPDMCWRSKTAKHEQYRKFLESTDDSFLTCVVEDLIRNGVLLNPVWSLPTLPTL